MNKVGSNLLWYTNFVSTPNGSEFKRSYHTFADLISEIGGMSASLMGSVSVILGFFNFKKQELKILKIITRNKKMKTKSNKDENYITNLHDFKMQHRFLPLTL